ncbi:hypothetical protein [Lichenicoccus sp.]|uniref:hypothetical protein n=1 Tax=Lichenicoccus sp. TaxID=2781899 RepID=UPI003D0FF718
MSTIANANATIAQVNSQFAEDAAERAACYAQMHGYQHDTASVDAARAYAACVRLVYGTSRALPQGALVALKLLVLACIASAAYGGWRLYREDREFPMACLGALLGFMISAILFGGGGLAVWFLVS